MSWPNITSTACTSMTPGTNCGIGSICTLNSQCAPGGCCGYKLPVNYFYEAPPLYIQYAG